MSDRKYLETPLEQKHDSSGEHDSSGGFKLEQSDVEAVPTRTAQLETLFQKYQAAAVIQPASEPLCRLWKELTQLTTSVAENLLRSYPTDSNGHIQPVFKRVERGPNGALRYRNAAGHTIWLKKDQVERCLQGRLRGATGECKPCPLK